ncbi:MAG: sugar ABC transporter ATP-binding protein [Roseiarcus sp.]|uniref:sugar ABC transporter ATP-binding protein n=1 Tax=Roseiarcus sp. TaxID=1969460 RepID=UPI003C20F136
MATPARPAEALLSLDAISKRFGNTQALDNVSLSFSAGRIHALIGENGAGKSTLVKIISGIVRPDSGSIVLSGERVAFATPSAASRAGISLVHQELALLPFNTVAENIFLGQEQRSKFGLSWSRMHEEAHATLDRLGVHVDVDRPVGELSTAHQQMVEIARATRRDSRMLILDEPTAALSPDDTRQLFDMLRQLAARGTAVVYISHRLDEIERVADDISVLKDGRCVATRAASELDCDSMIRLMVGRVIEDLFPPKPPRPTSDPLLAVDGLIDPPSIRGASFNVRKGEIVGLYGLEGHGQDEILACVAGARKPIAGRLAIEGRQIAWQPVTRMIEKRVGFVPGDRKSEGLILDMTGLQNITLPVIRGLSKWTFVSKSREKTLADDAAVLAGVKGDLTAMVRTLSGGNQQKLLLSRWLAARSSVLLLNQPTRGVDVGSKSEIYELIRRMCSERGVGALVVSREIIELQGLCDRILVMCRGVLVAEHRADDSEEAILASAVGQVQERSA